MKLKLSSELAWLIGFWKMRRARKGIGVFGEQEVQERFVQEVLKMKLVPPEKLYAEGKEVWFRHVKLENFFERVANNQTDIFNRPNKLTASYLKGMYESAGEGPAIRKASFKDKMLIERLGFFTRKVKLKDGKLGLFINKFNDFLSLINRFG